VSQSDDSTDTIRRPIPERMTLAELTQFVHDFAAQYDRDKRDHAKADKLASEERHHNFTRLAGNVQGIGMRQETFQAETLTELAEIRTAITGSPLGAKGLVQSINLLAQNVEELGNTIRNDRENSERRHVQTEAKIAPLLAASQAVPWYRSTIATSVWCTLAGGSALSFVVYVAPHIATILSGIK
jgi:hypothetical protein